MTRASKRLNLALFLLISLSPASYAQTTGPVVKGQKYDLATPYVQYEAVIPFQENGLWGFRDSQGKVKIKPKYQQIGTPQTYQMTSTWGDKTIDRSVIPVCLNNKWGFVAQNGKEIIKPIYDKVLTFQSERIKSGFNEGNLRGVVLVQKGDVFITVNDKGKQTDAPVLQSVVSAGPMTYSTDNGQLQIISAPENTEVTPKGYLYMVYFNYNSNPEAIIHPVSGEYLTIDESYDNNYIVSNQEGKSGMLNQNGEWLVPAEYECNVANNLLLITKDNLTGACDLKTGSTLVPVEYHSVSPGYNNNMVVSKDGLYGLYNVGSHTLSLPMQYSHMESAGNGYYVVGKQDKQGLIGPDFNIVIPIEHKGIGAVIGSTIRILDDDPDNQTLWSLTKNEPICHNYSGWYNYIDGHGLPIACGNKKGLLGANGELLLRPNYTDFKSRPNMDGRRGYLYTYNANGIGLAYADGSSGYVIVEPGKFTLFNNEYETDFITGEIGKGNGAAICKKNNKIIGPHAGTEAVVKGDKVYFLQDNFGTTGYCYNSKGALVGSAVIRTKSDLSSFISRTLSK